MPLPPNSTISTVWPGLTHPQGLRFRRLNKMRQCNSANGNSKIKIGVLGERSKTLLPHSFFAALGQTTNLWLIL